MHWYALWLLAQFWATSLTSISHTFPNTARWATNVRRWWPERSASWGRVGLMTGLSIVILLTGCGDSTPPPEEGVSTDGAAKTTIAEPPFIPHSLEVAIGPPGGRQPHRSAQDSELDSNGDPLNEEGKELKAPPGLEDGNMEGSDSGEDSSTQDGAESGKKNHTVTLTMDHFSDVKGLSDKSRRSRLLKLALKSATEKGVFTEELPEGQRQAKPRKFAPKKPITRGEFARWLITYQDVIPLDPPEATFSDVPTTRKDYVYIEAATRANWLNYFQTGDESPYFKPDMPMTRGDLVKVYAWVRGEEKDAEALTPVKLGELNQADFGSQSIDSAADYSSWDMSLRPYIGWAFQNQLLSRVFHLSPETLFQGDGFQPNQAATREEALLLLQEIQTEN